MFKLPAPSSHVPRADQSLKLASPARSVWPEPCQVAHMQFGKVRPPTVLPSPRDRAGPVVAFARGNLPHPQDTCRDTEGCTDSPLAHESTHDGSLVLRANVTLDGECRCCCSFPQQSVVGSSRMERGMANPAASPILIHRRHPPRSLSPATPTTAPRSTARPPSTWTRDLQQAARGAV